MPLDVRAEKEPGLALLGGGIGPLVQWKDVANPTMIGYRTPWKIIVGLLVSFVIIGLKEEKTT